MVFGGRIARDSLFGKAAEAGGPGPAVPPPIRPAARREGGAGGRTQEAEGAPLPRQLDAGTRGSRGTGMLKGQLRVPTTALPAALRLLCACAVRSLATPCGSTLRWRPSHGAYHGVHLPARLYPRRQRALLLGAGVCVESAYVANCVGQLTLSAAHVPLPFDLRSAPSALRTHLGVKGVCPEQPDNDLQLATSRCVQCATCSVQHAPCAPGVQEPDGRKDGHRQPPLHVHKHLRKRQSRAAQTPTARPNFGLTDAQILILAGALS